MMHKLISIITLLTLKLRYKITVTGLENFDLENKTSKKGGFLLLPNHPTFLVDPSLLICYSFKKTIVRPVVIDARYYVPYVQSILSYFKIVPIPGFAHTINSYKLKKLKSVLEKISKGLENGESFIFYPAGRTKLVAKEEIKGVSGLHHLLNQSAQFNILLVRTTGLWGSSFSWANPDNPPYMGTSALNGIKHTLKNLIFFNPRRKITIEFVKPPLDFPLHSSKNILNKWLENWYNREGPFYEPEFVNGEPVVKVPYSCWSKKVDDEEWRKQTVEEASIELDKIPPAITKKVLSKISEISNIPVEEINPKMTLTTDLDIDSIGVTQLVLFLEQEFNIQDVIGEKLNRVETVLGVAAGLVETPDVEELDPIEFQRASCDLQTSATTVFGAFLQREFKDPSQTACADDLRGAISYHQLKNQALVLAKVLKNFPETKIGVATQASITSVLILLAFRIAHKIPVVIDWTRGPQFIQEVVSAASLKTCISSFQDLDSMSNVDFGSFVDSIHLIDDLVNNYPILKKLKATTFKKHKNYHLNDMQTVASIYHIDANGKILEESLTDRIILDELEGFKNQFQIKKEDLILVIAPPFYRETLTIFQIGFLALGVPVYFFHKTSIRKLLEAIDHLDVTVVYAPYKIIEQLKHYTSHEKVAALKFISSDNLKNTSPAT